MQDGEKAILRLRTALILGGARSGKSRYAQRLAERAALERIYVATAAAGDEEMRRRIVLHQAERGAGWRTLETTTQVCDAVAAQVGPHKAVLVDCITLWLANLMFAGADVGAEIDHLAQAVAAAGGPLVLVSNEVGMGLVPETALGRDFRDWQGKANQRLAEACGLVIFVAAGLPIRLKPRLEDAYHV